MSGTNRRRERTSHSRCSTVWMKSLLMLMVTCLFHVVASFTVGGSTRTVHLDVGVWKRKLLVLSGVSSDDGSTIRGDAVRAATGIRPSLHPTTINAIAEALKVRAINSDPNMPLVVFGDVQPLDVALSAGKIAATAIEKRQTTSTTDGMALLPEEGQTIAGRVVGVVMRLDELEAALLEKVSRAEWVKKYNEWEAFGVLEDPAEIPKHIQIDPLFAICRAECLLALFLCTVEAPQMAKIGQSVPGGSTVDFIDADRQEVLLDEQFGKI